jgi:hypothetical protein
MAKRASDDIASEDDVVSSSGEMIVAMMRPSEK